MKIRWNQTEEFEVIDQYDEELDNIAESHDEVFKKGDIDEVDIINHNGDAADLPEYVDIQFGNGSIITSLHRMAFTVIDERTSTIEDCENCDEENCDVRHCLISGPHEDKFPLKEKPKADFLWPVEKGSVEEAGYEFANARTEKYREEWWKILLARASEIEKIDETE